MENENQDGSKYEQAPDQDGQAADVLSQQDGNAGEEHGNAEAQSGADASGGPRAEERAGAEVSAAEFEEYVNGELNALAQKLNYRKIVLVPIPREELWPSWFYDPITKEGVVCKSEGDVPEGYVRNPFTNAE